MKRSPPALAALLALALPGAAAAHGVRAELERRDQEVVVRATYHGGRPLAGARFDVVSPARPGESWSSGTTDREGRVTFVPDAPGAWEVRIVDATGHGRVVRVDVAAPAPAEARPPAAAEAPRPAPVPVAPARDGGLAGTALRTLAGALAIALVFGAAWIVGRRRRAARR